MSIWDGIMMAIDNLRKRKGRTFLTALGVAIGTASIVGMLALGIGLQKSSMEGFEQGMSDLSILSIYPKYPEGGVAPGKEVKISEDDIEKLAKIPNVLGVTPIMRYNGQADITVGRRVAEWVTVIGVDTKVATKMGYKLSEGVFFTGANNEAVASYMLPLTLQQKHRKSRNNKEGTSTGGMVDPGMGGGMVGSSSSPPQPSAPKIVGKSVTLTAKKDPVPNADGSMGIPQSRDFKVKIVGRMAEGTGDYGSSVYLDIDTVTDMQKWYSSGTATTTRASKGSYSEAMLKVDDIKNVEAVVAGIRSAGFDTWSMAESVKEMNKYFFIMQLILGGIGALSLLVASIGIVNTMIMSILERTKEIGIMKVIGATIPQIKHMFLVEAAIIGTIGGLAGIVICYILMAVLNFVAITFGGDMGSMIGNVANIPIWLSVSGIAFSTIVGILAGIYPANKAANISALQAIRED